MKGWRCQLTPRPLAWWWEPGTKTTKIELRTCFPHRSHAMFFFPLAIDIQVAWSRYLPLWSGKPWPSWCLLGLQQRGWSHWLHGRRLSLRPPQPGVDTNALFLHFSSLIHQPLVRGPISLGKGPSTIWVVASLSKESKEGRRWICSVIRVDLSQWPSNQ